MLNKIYIVIFLALCGVLAAMLAYLNYQIDQNYALKAQNALISAANKDLNQTLNDLIINNQKEREIIKKNYENQLLNTNKKAKIQKKVSESNESDFIVLFNSIIDGLFEQNATNQN